MERNQRDPAPFRGKIVHHHDQEAVEAFFRVENDCSGTGRCQDVGQLVDVVDDVLVAKLL